MRGPVSSSRWQLAFAAASAGAWEWDLRTNRVSWSTTLEELHGLRAGSFPGTLEASEAFVHPADRDRVITALRAVPQGPPPSLEYRILRLDGGIRWVESRNRLVVDDAGKPMYLLGLCFDVTDSRAEAATRFNALREKMDELARRSREALGVLVAHNPEALFVRRGDTILFANDALARLAGCADGSALAGLPAVGLVPPEERSRLAALLASNASAPARLHLLRPDGTRVPIDLRQGSAAEVDGQPTVAVSVRAVEVADPVAATAEELALQARELVDRAVSRAAEEGASPRLRGLLDEISGRLDELHHAVAALGRPGRAKRTGPVH